MWRRGDQAASQTGTLWSGTTQTIRCMTQFPFPHLDRVSASKKKTEASSQAFSFALGSTVTSTHLSRSLGSVVIGTGFGGEGFKFGIFIGETLANAALGRAPSVAGVQQRFRPSRLPLYRD
jgi:glycine/D-amino acid oxidase-like deaminating enzyme